MPKTAKGQSDGAELIGGLTTGGAVQALKLDSSGNLQVSSSGGVGASVSIADPNTPANKAAVDATGALKVAATVNATNPSVGTNGSAIPTSSTLVGASDGTNLQGLTVESASNKNLRVAVFNAANELAIDGSGRLTVLSSLQAGSNLIGTVELADAAGTNKLAIDASGRLTVLSTLQAGSNLIGTIEIADAAGTNKLAIDASGRLTLVPNSSMNVAQWAGASPSVSNPVYTSQSLASGYVAAFGSNPAAMTANTDYQFKWGAGGTTVVNHIMIQNNTASNIQWDLDTTSNAGSPVLAPSQTIFLDVQTTVLHLLSTGTPNVNGSTGSNVVVRAWL